MLGRFGVIVGVTSSLMAAGSADSHGQDTTSSVRVRAQSFVFARYASASTSSLYVAQGLGRVGAFVGMVQNARTTYHELVVGTFTQVNWNGQSIFAAVAYADASESQYVFTYLEPTFFVGPVLLSGTVKWYAPLGRSGTRQIHLNPLALEVRLANHLWAGGTYILGLTEHHAPAHRVGGAIEWLTSKNTVRLEVLERTRDHLVEVRSVFLANF